LFLQPPDFADWLKKYIVNSNSHYSHAEFKEGIKSKKLVVLFPIIDAFGILRGWRAGAFNLSVLIYRLGPLLASLLALYLTKNAWYLAGIFLPEFFGKSVSLFLRNTMQQVQAVAVFLIIAAILWHFNGLNHWSTFSVFCVAWRLGGFFLADSLQGRLALGVLLSDPKLFEDAAGSGRIYINHARMPSFMRYRYWRRWK
jgi:hypothetical protein